MKQLRFDPRAKVTISIIVPVYRGARWIRRCLESLKRQSLSQESYEIILVFNGPDDGAKHFAEAFAKLNTHIRIIIVSSDANNASKARNEGIKYVTASHLTWVDVDDTVSPHYLLALALANEPDVIPVAQLANVNEAGFVDRANIINEDLLSQKTDIILPSSFPRATTFMTAKLIPTDWVISNPFPEELKSGEDVAFYGKLLSNYNFKLSITPGLIGATYFRQLVAESVSRGRKDRQFMVVERALVIKSLEHSLENCKTTNGPIIQSYINSQLSFIRNYVNQNPDQRIDIMDYLSSLNYHKLPWARFNDVVEDLAICYNFAPFSDTGANVAAKRIRAAGRSTDIISNNMAKVRENNPENSRLSAPYISKHHQLGTPVTFANPSAILEFVERGLAQFHASVNSGRVYKRIYSRSMWPASHFLAAAIRVNNPEIEWTAEFSDPVRLTTDGTFRTQPLSLNESAKILFGLTPDKLPDELVNAPDVYEWTELLPYLFADQLVFTNEHQYQVMKGSAQNSVQKRIEVVSSIAHHPTLPASYYEIGTPHDYGSDTTINIGYFGEFYSTRGLTEILDALDELSPTEQAGLKLHVHSSTTLPEKYDRLAGRVIFSYGKLSFYDFLASLNNLDCLIVNDASTLDHHLLNPYLPSKYSDYKGSFTPIWSVVEPGSVLSSQPNEYQSNLGDTLGAKAILQSLLLKRKWNK